MEIHEHPYTLSWLAFIGMGLLIATWWFFSISSVCNRTPLNTAVILAVTGGGIGFAGMVAGRRNALVVAGFVLLQVLFFVTFGILGMASMSGYEGQCP